MLDKMNGIIKRPEQYRADYYGFLNLKRAFPKVKHADHEPQPRNYCIDDREAAFIRVEVEREFYR